MTGLLDRLRARAAAAPGRVGVAMLDEGGGEIIALDGDGVYPAASVIKLPIVMTLFDDDAEGRLSLSERMPIGAHVGGSGVLNDLVDVNSMTLRDLAALTMQVSDNTATNHLIERVGIDHVNERLRGWGCRKSVLQRKLYDAEGKARGLENVMTPRETASLLGRVRAGAARGDRASSGVLRLLEHNQNTQRLGAFLPLGVTLAHKDGWLHDPEFSENDAGIVRARSSVVAVGFTHRLHRTLARPLLGLIGLAAAEVAGADLSGLPPEVLRSA